MKDVVNRALKTFVEAFLASWALTGNAMTKNAIVGAAAAAIAAVWNAILQTKK